MRLAAIMLALLALTACGGHHKTTSPGEVVRAWSAALDRNDSEAGARLFADGARVIQGDVQTLATHSDAVQWNASLPCGGTITLLEPRSNGEVLAVFSLTDRPGHLCDGPGDQAAALFQVKNGKIVLWHEVDVPAFPPAGALA
jgi:limonene-1,2-epoxide hydrolase